MKKNILLSILFTFISFSSMGSEFDSKGELNCSTAYGSYDEVQKFQINNMRDVTFHTLGETVADVCQAENKQIVCDYDGYEITVDLNTVMESRHFDSDELEGFRVIGTIDTFWRAESSVSCFQEVKK